MTRVLLVAMACAGAAANAAEGLDTSSGFLTDYSLLQPSTQGQVGQFIYLAPNVVEKLVGYNTVIVDQPTLALAADSKLKSIKPDDSKLIADALRQVITDEIAKGYTIAQGPGQGVLAVRTNLSNVFLEKKGRGILGYTPVGFVVTTAKGALLDDVMDKVKLAQVNLEAEVVDSTTGEVLAAVVDARGNRTDKKEFTSWSEVEAEISVWGQRLKCNLDNARVAPDQRTDCLAIVAQKKK